MRTNVNEQAFKVIAASIADKVSADKIAADKKGQVITDPSDPKKFAVIFYDKNAKTLESIKATTTPDELKSTMDKISVLRKKRNDMEIELCKFKEAGDTDEVENREAEIETINADIRQLAESVGINEHIGIPVRVVQGKDKDGNEQYAVLCYDVALYTGKTRGEAVNWVEEYNKGKSKDDQYILAGVEESVLIEKDLGYAIQLASMMKNKGKTETEIREVLKLSGLNDNEQDTVMKYSSELSKHANESTEGITETVNQYYKNQLDRIIVDNKDSEYNLKIIVFGQLLQTNSMSIPKGNEHILYDLFDTTKIKVDSNEMDEGKIPNKPDMDKEEDMINALLEKYGLVEKKEKVQEVTEDKVTVDVEGVEKTVDVKKVDGKLEISIKTKEDEPAPAAPIVVEKPEADVSSPESAPAPEPLPEPEAEKSEVEKEEELEDVTPKTVESVEMLDNRKIKLEEIKEDKGVDIDMDILNEFTKRI